jgi:hypothetical protein
MHPSPRIIAYKRLVTDYLSKAQVGWAHRDEGPAYIREINDAATTILRFASPSEREEFYALLDDESVARMVYGKILADNQAPQEVRDKALSMLKSDSESGQFM